MLQVWHGPPMTELMFFFYEQNKKITHLCILTLDAIGKQSLGCSELP
jgi:hypothetical protein